MASAPGKFFHPGIFSSVGEPQRSQIISNWWPSLSPERIGLPTSISPNTHLRLSVSHKVDMSCKKTEHVPNSPHVNGRRVGLEMQ